MIIIDIKTGESFDLGRGDFCVIDDITHVSSVAFDSLPHARWATSIATNEFEPHELIIRFIKYNEFQGVRDELFRFLCRQGARFILERERRDGVKFYCVVTYRGAESERIGVTLQHARVTLTRESMYYRKHRRVHDVSGREQTEGEGYTITYPHTYPGSTQGSFDSSTLQWEQRGDTPATFQFDIRTVENLVYEPTIDIDGQRYVATDGLNVQPGATLTITNSPEGFGITMNDGSEAARRDFAERTYIEAERGPFVIRFTNLEYVEITMFEYFEHLGGVIV